MAGSDLGGMKVFQDDEKLGLGFLRNILDFQ